MKKSTLLLSAVILTLLNGCGGVKGFLLYDTDKRLETVKEVRAFPKANHIAFEWKKIESSRVQGINIYRGSPEDKFRNDQGFRRIGSIGNRYGTHFVDTKVKPDTKYLYIFTTFSLVRESAPSPILRLKTLAPFEGVSFVKAYKESANVVKLLWRPHSDGRVSGYIVEKSVNGGKWEYLAQVEGRLMVEYIDTSVATANQYTYRIIARSYDGINAKPSKTTDISL